MNDELKRAASVLMVLASVSNFIAAIKYLEPDADDQVPILCERLHSYGMDEVERITTECERRAVPYMGNTIAFNKIYETVLTYECLKLAEDITLTKKEKLN
jgi:hypothetical protein